MRRLLLHAPALRRTPLGLAYADAGELLTVGSDHEIGAKAAVAIVRSGGGVFVPSPRSARSQ